MTDAQMDALRERVDARGEGIPRSPYDALGQVLEDLIVGELVQAVTDTSFAQKLQRLGYAIVPLTDGEAPAPPVDWLQSGLDLTCGAAMDPIELLEHLYAEAWDAGFDAAGGTQ